MSLILAFFFFTVTRIAKVTTDLNYNYIHNGPRKYTCNAFLKTDSHTAEDDARYLITRRFDLGVVIFVNTANLSIWQ